MSDTNTETAPATKAKKEKNVEATAPVEPKVFAVVSTGGKAIQGYPWREAFC